MEIIQTMVIVVGTRHSIQAGADSSYRAASEDLKSFLESLCRTYDVQGVAEEMSTEALAEKKCSASVPMRLANFLGLEHRLCDPERSERDRLGICQENDIRAQAFSQNWSEAKISSSLVESHTKREQYWLGKLRNLNRWPVVFVCGADHVDSFCALLEQEAFSVHVAAKDWTSSNMVATAVRDHQRL